MTDKKNTSGKEVLEAFRKELHGDLERSPARLELERRKLVARITTASDKRAAPRLRTLAISFAGAAAVMAAVLIINMDFGASPSEPAQPLEVSGFWKVKPGDPIFSGRPVTVPDQGGAKLLLEDNTTIWLAGSAKIEAPKGLSSGFNLESGRLIASVSKRDGDAPFTIHTPHGEVIVHGTVFSVTAESSGMIVRLHEGAVELDTGREAVHLTPGHRLEVKKGLIRQAAPIDRAEVMADLMIVEKTRHLKGPPVPPLTSFEDQVENPEPEDTLASTGPVKNEVTAEPAEKNALKPAKPNRKSPPPQPQNAPDAGPERFKVEFFPPVADKLFLDAYSEFQSGNHSTGRELLEEYLQTNPKGRYWTRVKEILGESETP